MSHTAFMDKASYRQAWSDAYETDPAIPLNLDIELASTCNASCTFCLYGDRDWADSMKEKDWDGKTKKRFMPTDLAIQLIDDAHRIGIPALKMNFRGESTLHKDYSLIMKHAADKIHFVDLLVNTNGNCRDESIPGLMHATKVMVSLDSMDPAVYPKVRVGLSLDRAIAVITELVRLGHPDLWVRRVVCKDNQSEDFVGAVKKRWPTGLKVSEHHAFDRSHYSNQAVYETDPSGWERTYCGYPSQRVVVDASARFVPCCIAWEGEFDAMEMRYPNTSIMGYWNSDFRKNLAKELRANILSNSKCKKCTSFMAFKRPERDKVQDVEVGA